MWTDDAVRYELVEGKELEKRKNVMRKKIKRRISPRPVSSPPKISEIESREERMNQVDVYYHISHYHTPKF